MAGTIIADDLKHSNNDTVGTEYLINGSAKAWLDMLGTGTISIKDSFNISSITDNATSDYSHSYSTSMNSANFSLQALGVQTTAGSYGQGVMGTNFSKTASSVRHEFMRADSNQYDLFVNTVSFGDLA